MYLFFIIKKTKDILVTSILLIMNNNALNISV